MTDLRVAAVGMSRRFASSLGPALRYACADVARDLICAARPTGLRPGEFWALRDVSFALRKGEGLGVLGPNGAGKSTLVRLLLGSLRLHQGRCEIHGRVAALSPGLGFDPVLSGRENAFVAAALSGPEHRRFADRFDDMVEFAGLREAIDSPLQFYSSGMRARLGFSVAMCLEPDILVIDEALAVGDLGFQGRCIERIQRYLGDGGSLLLISHSPHLVLASCARALVLDRGRVAFSGDVTEGVERYTALAEAGESRRGAGDRAGVLTSSDLSDPSHESGVRITSFGIRPEVGVDLATGQPAWVFAQFDASRRRDVRWGFRILSADLRTSIASEASAALRLPHRGELCCRLPRLPLLEGRYALCVVILDENRWPLAFRGFIDAPVFFDVTTPGAVSDRDLRLLNHDLLVIDDLDWRPVSAQPSASEPATGRPFDLATVRE